MTKMTECLRAHHWYVFLSFSVSWGVACAAEPIGTYSDPEFGFSIHYPVHWESRPGALADTRLRIVPSAPDVACFVKVMISERFKNSRSTGDAAEAMLSTISKTEALMQTYFSDYQFLESSRVKIKNTYYLKTVAQFTGLTGEKTRNIEVWAASNGRLYNVACTAADHNFDAYRKAFEGIIGSFQLAPLK